MEITEQIEQRVGGDQRRSSRLITPFTQVKLMVWIRQNHINLPFTTRIYTGRSKRNIVWVTCYALIMPDRNDLAGEPILQYMDTNRFIAATESPELRSVLARRIAYFAELLSEATFDRLLEMDQKLIKECNL